MQLKLNGVAIPDAALAAAIAGDFGVLLVFASGDQTFAEQIKRLLGQTVAVKQAIGFNAATMLPPQETQRRIREGVKRAIERRGEMKPYRLSRPITLEVTFKQTVNAELVSYLPGVERPGGDTIVFTGRDMNEISRFLCAIMFLHAN
jgi:D-amino peptidase